MNLIFFQHFCLPYETVNRQLGSCDGWEGLNCLPRVFHLRRKDTDGLGHHRSLGETRTEGTGSGPSGHSRGWSLEVCAVSCGCRHKEPQTVWLQQHRNLFSHNSRAQKSEIKMLAGLFSSDVSLVYRWPSSPRVFPWSSLSSLIFYSYGDTSHLGLGSMHMTSFYLNHLF